LENKQNRLAVCHTASLFSFQRDIGAKASELVAATASSEGQAGSVGDRPAQ
jgi:hypothetical protein